MRVIFGTRRNHSVSRVRVHFEVLDLENYMIKNENEKLGILKTPTKYHYGDLVSCISFTQIP